jgi:hypothetical protein
MECNRDDLEDVIYDRYSRNISCIMKLRSDIECYKEALNLDINPKEKVTSKIGKKQALALSSKLVAPFNNRNDIVSINSTTSSEFRAKLDEKLINNLWRKDRFSKNIINEMVSYLVFEGTAFLETGWKYKEEVVFRREINDENYEAFKKLEGSSSLIRIVESGDKRYVEFIEKLVNEPFIDVHSINDVVFDCESVYTRPLSWFIVESSVSYEDLLLNDDYDRDVIKRIYDRAKKERLTEEYYNRIDDDRRDKIKLLRYYGYDIGKDAKPIMVVCIYDSSRVYIIDKKVQPFPFDTIPIAPVKLYDVDNRIYGRPLQWAISSEDKFSESLKRAIVDNLANSNYSKVFYRKGSLTSAQIKNYTSSNSPFIEINSRDRISDVIQQGNFNPLPSSVFALLQMLDVEASSITGVNSVMQGVLSNDIKAPASNFANVIASTSTRIDEFISNITDGLKIVFELWVEMFSEYYDDDDILRITDINMSDVRKHQLSSMIESFGVDSLPESERDEVKLFLAQEIDKRISVKSPNVKYEFKFSVSSVGLKQQRINDDMIIIQHLSSLAQVGAFGVDEIRLIVADIFENMDRLDLAKKLREYRPQPNQLEEQMMQLNIAEKSAEVEAKRGKAMKEAELAKNATARSKLTEAKATKEMASLDADVAKKYLEIVKESKELDVDGDSVTSSVEPKDIGRAFNDLPDRVSDVSK